MENDKIIDGNKIIAEFMGEKVAIEVPIGFGGDKTWSYVHPSSVKNWTNAKLFYHSSWDNLMLVVKKIYGICQKMEGIVITPSLDITQITIFADIERVWNAVVEFVKWYNTQLRAVS